MSEIPHHTGGCQCGAVRFRVDGPLGTASICHCRMCQKAFGGFYGPLVNIERDAAVTWTRGEPARYQSSNLVTRGFCAVCGTPLTYESPEEFALAIGAFDHPERIEPVIQYGLESKVPYVDRLPDLPTRTTDMDSETTAFLKSIHSHQHPDHDTEDWPADAHNEDQERPKR